jgi:hypothetical protein
MSVFGLMLGTIIFVAAGIGSCVKLSPVVQRATKKIEDQKDN